ncbi:DUF4350 domain-containing protein [Candidatus Frankia alpina]|uniref:DUF4350 domain-containing protein n=1 Tax=Candidatus Frankia alpina TaxID=2699483 RepID=A0A4S5ES54_9ACTN|nr:DUF4350 domain-containing protein [Candidatus Frankia alpina]THJ74900.1 DUF4350 domain-containing protein [Candidatus Frankia alpina]
MTTASGTLAPGGASPGGGSPSAVRSGPRPPAVRRGVLVVAVVGALLLGFLVVTALVTRPAGRPALDLASAESDGTRALAQILRARGVVVSPADAAPAGSAGQQDTLVVVRPGRLAHDALTDLLGRVWRGSDVVLVAPDDAVLDALDVGVVIANRQPAGGESDPRCAMPEAATAGSAAIGGSRAFTRTSDGDLGDMKLTLCYGDPPGAAELAVLNPGRAAAAPAAGRLVLLGSADFLTNRELDRSGNAALTLGLLTRHPTLSWITPAADADGGVGTRSVAELLPAGFRWACLQAGVVLVLLALWRGRRLGPPLPEPLPVIVRAAETVEGHGRLYATAHARDRAADALRAGTRVRLAEHTGLPAFARPGGAPGPDPVALVASISERTGRSPSEIGSLLYGSGMPPQTTGVPSPIGRARDRYQSRHLPPDVSRPAAQAADGGPGPRRGTGRPGERDAALLALARALDELDRQVGGR